MSLPTLQSIFQSIPDRFRPTKAQGYESVVHFDITGDEPLQFSVRISNGACQLEEGLNGNTSCVVKSKSKHYIALESGEMNPQLAILTGKVKVSNINEMLRFSKCFIPYHKYVQKPDTAKKIERKPTSGPLLGYRILDLSRLLPGPWATAMLADMGAEVIKIEDPESPDYVRDYPPIIDGKSANYMAWNRSKRSTAISLRTEAGKQQFLKLVKSADVVVEQFRPGVIDQWGLGYEEAKKVNPKIIYVSLTGFGQTGPMAQTAGHDLNYLALSGVLSLNKDERGKPVIPGTQLADIASGTYQTIQAVMAALLSRHQTGEGQHVDVSMTDGLLPFATIAFNTLWSGQKPVNQAMALSGGLPNYNVYRTADDKWVALGALEPKFWSIFCDMVNRPEWKEKALPNHPDADQTKKEVIELFQSKTRAAWEELGSKHDICLTSVLELDEVEHHPHFQSREMFDHSSSIPLINQPIKFTGTPSQIQWQAPELGEDEV